MRKRDAKHRLANPWDKLKVVLWLVGLVVLGITNWWWPGILVLVAISILYEVLLMKYFPSSIEKPRPLIQDTSLPEGLNKPDGKDDKPIPDRNEHRIDLLPLTCPKCGGPIKGHSVNWTSQESADCPFCGTNLPLEKDKN
jgi:hypothetical protein